MVDGIFDPLPLSPYYLRILDPEEDRNSIREMRIRSLRLTQSPDKTDPKLLELAEPLPYGHYTELIHRETGHSAGLVECFSYLDAAAYAPSSPLIRYFDQYISQRHPAIGFHLHTYYLKETHREKGVGLLFLSLLNCLFYKSYGVGAMTFSSNSRYYRYKKLFINFGTVELEEVNRAIRSEGLWDETFCYFDLEKVLKRCMRIYEQRYFHHTAQDMAIIADRAFWDAGPELHHSGFTGIT